MKKEVNINLQNNQTLLESQIRDLDSFDFSNRVGIILSKSAFF